MASTASALLTFLLCTPGVELSALFRLSLTSVEAGGVPSTDARADAGRKRGVGRFRLAAELAGGAGEDSSCALLLGELRSLIPDEG